MGPSLRLISKVVIGAVWLLGLAPVVEGSPALGPAKAQGCWAVFAHSVTTAARVMSLLGLSSVLLFP